MKKRTMLDLCCGLGGASRRFREKGWKVIGLDNDPLFKPEILLDLRDYVPGLWEQGVEFLWASPPCVEFSRRRFDRESKPSVELVTHVKRVIETVKPRYWCVENVRLSVPYISRVLGRPRLTVGPFFLWGTFPKFIPPPVPKKGAARGPKWMLSAIRARIPYELSCAMEEAVSYALRAEESGGRPGFTEPWQREMFEGPDAATRAQDRAASCAATWSPPGLAAGAGAAAPARPTEASS